MTPLEHARLQSALASSRRGAATLMELAEAHEVAARHRMTEELGYLRAQIRGLTQGPNGANGDRLAMRKAAVRNVGFGVFVGVLAGICTHFILVAAGQRHIVARS